MTATTAKKNIVTLILCLLPLLCTAESIEPQSVYQFESIWLNQNAESVELSVLRGTPQLVAFVYTYCEHTCPLIIEKIKQLIDALPEKSKAAIHVTLISLDPKRDQPSQLKSYMNRKSLSERQWTMLNGDPDDVRVLSNMFNVKYKPMQNDELAHSNIITLLDNEGIIRYQLKGMGEGFEKIIKAVNVLK